jgi:RNA polymerase sigma-70 factor (ECF subfamily)
VGRAAAFRGPSKASRDVDFEQVYRKQVGFVWRSLRGLGVPDAGLEDATHEVFLVLHRRWGDWDGQSRMTTWLYGIATGVARNHRRGLLRAERKLAAVREQSPADPADSGVHENPGRALDRKQAAQLVEDFVEQLDAEKRRVFELCEIEGLTAPDAARCLGLNVNTLGSRLRRVRAQFQQYVADLRERSR